MNSGTEKPQGSRKKAKTAKTISKFEAKRVASLKADVVDQFVAETERAIQDVPMPVPYSYQTPYEKMQVMIAIMNDNYVDEIHFDGIVIKKTIHVSKSPEAVLTPNAESELSTEDELDVELFGQSIKRREV